jgi:tetratricopeptide (TPR) repeat protein
MLIIISAIQNILGDKQGAIDDYTKAISIEPKFTNAYNNRGQAKYSLGNKQGAIADFKKLAELYRQQNRMDLYELTIDKINSIR